MYKNFVIIREKNAKASSLRGGYEVTDAAIYSSKLKKIATASTTLRNDDENRAMQAKPAIFFSFLYQIATSKLKFLLAMTPLLYEATTAILTNLLAMTAKSLILFLIFLLQACSIKAPKDKTFLTATAHKLEKKYKINHAELVVQYDLTSNKSIVKCLYAKNLGLIINNEQQNKIFLNRFHNRNSVEFNQAAGVKIIEAKNLLTKLHTKYKFLSRSESLYFAKTTAGSGSNIHELTKIDKIINTIPLMMPEYEAKITSHYGTRKSPHKKKYKKSCFHSGIDLQVKKLPFIYASASGVVTKVARVKDYGNFVEITHPRKLVTKYAHLKEIHVKEGDKIVRGQMIGVQGKTGNATGEHLHFEILLDNKPINPFDFLSHCYSCK